MIDFITPEVKEVIAEFERKTGENLSLREKTIFNFGYINGETNAYREQQKELEKMK